MHQAVMLISGGMDSTTLLYDLLNTGYHVKALSVNYSQRHIKELTHVERVIAHARQSYPAKLTDHQVVKLDGIVGMLKSSQTTASIAVPEGHYEEESMKQTVVPNRNMIMLSIAAGWALSEGIPNIFFAAHGGDHAIYPDCRQPFVDAFAKAVYIGNWTEHATNISAPYVELSKADICALGISLGVPYELTWTCYQGGNKHCGKCGTCVERIEAFQLNNTPDPVFSHLDIEWKPGGKVRFDVRYY